MFFTAVTIFDDFFTLLFKIASYHYLNQFMKRNLLLIIILRSVET